jgi:glycosyltransferase involved in cell wall biosynthesis
MISSLLTIIIPSKDSVLDLKKTIENLVLQTKIKGTRVIVADFNSNDGSSQYSIQASSELIKSLKIFPVNIKENEIIGDLIDRITTPYVMIISPGAIISDKDLIIKSLNDLFNSEHTLVYLEKNSLLDALLLPLMKRKRKAKLIFSKKEILSHISIVNLEKSDREFLIDNKILNTGIKIPGFIN